MLFRIYTFQISFWRCFKNRWHQKFQKACHYIKAKYWNLNEISVSFVNYLAKTFIISKIDLLDIMWFEVWQVDVVSGYSWIMFQIVIQTEHYITEHYILSTKVDKDMLAPWKSNYSWRFERRANAWNVDCNLLFTAFKWTLVDQI